MIEFVDIKDGRTFQGEPPYEFWFDGGQSVNLNYVQKICFISPYRHITAILDSDVFFLLNTNRITPAIEEIINGKTYMDIDDLKTNQLISVGAPYNNFYVHIIYILGCSHEVGEIHDNFTLIENGVKYTYNIAADFYGDNESLKLNLNNFNVNIPESIQKAIYNVDIHEDANDNITLNRKYKELLMNYWDIIANKGSYNSLINSLAWFEWGDLVRIEEFWKRHHEGMEEYFQTELNKEPDYETITEFLNNTKTTYIGLYLALSHITIQDGELVYQHDTQPTESNAYIYDENNPEIFTTTTRWQIIDLCLKMTLLGNFFNTYFTPIHIDSIHSTLEYWVFSYAIKVLHTTCAESEIFVNNIRTFDMIWNEEVRMMQHNCKNYSDTPFLNPITNGPVFGYEDTLRTEPNPSFTNSGEFVRYHMGGIYGVVRFRITKDNPILAVNQNDRIIHARVVWERLNPTNQSERTGHIDTYPSYSNTPTGAWFEPVRVERTGYRLTQWAFSFDFRLGFMDADTYNLTFEFETLSGGIWTKSITLEIKDSTRNSINFYRVMQRDDIVLDPNDDPSTILPYFINNQDSGLRWMRSFQMDRGFTRSGVFQYDQHGLFLQQFYGHGVDVNHTVIFDVTIPQTHHGDYSVDDSNTLDFYLNGNDTPDISFDIYDHYEDDFNNYHYRYYDDDTYEFNYENFINNFPTFIPEYVWVVEETVGENNDLHLRFIGVRRYFGTDETWITITNVCNNETPLTPMPNPIPDEPPASNPNISYRFQPFMHTLIPIDGTSHDADSYTFKITDLIYMIPQLGHSRDLDVVNWKFINTSTGEYFESYLTNMQNDPEHEDYGGMMGWFVSPQVPVNIKPGYYDMELNYLKGDVPQQYQVKSVFLMEK